MNYFNTNIYTDYEKKFGKHYLKFLIGGQSEYYYKETTRVATNNVLLDEKPFLSSTSTKNLISDKLGEWASMGFFE